MSKRLKKKALIMIVVEVLCLILLGGFLMGLQTNLSVGSQKKDIQEKLGQMQELIDQADEAAAQNTASYDDVYKSKAESVAFMARQEGFEVTNANMEFLAELMNISNVMIVDKEGNILASANKSEANFEYERYNQLRTVFTTGQAATAFDVEIEGNLRRFYGAKIDDLRQVVVEHNPRELTELEDSMSSWEAILGKISVGKEGYAFAVSSQDYTFKYHPDESLIGTDALTVGINPTEFEEGYCGWMNINGERIYGGVTYIEADNVYVFLAVPESEIASSRNITVGVILFVVFVVLTIVVSYALLLSSDLEKHTIENETHRLGKMTFNDVIAHKIGAMSAIGLVVILIATFYMQTLFAISNESMAIDQRVKEVEKTLTANQKNVENLTAQYNRRHLNKGLVAAHILSGHKELWTKEKLNELSDALDAEYMFIYDNQGKEILSDASYVNFEISDNPEDSSYEFRKLLQGVEYVIQDARYGELSGKYSQYVGVSLKDENGNPDGFVELAIDASKMEEALATTRIDSILQGIKIGTNGFTFAVDKESKNFTYHPEEKLIGRSALEYGIEESQLRDGFSDYMNINNKKYFGSCLETDKEYIFAVIPDSEMSGSRFPVAIATGVASFLALAFIFVILTIEKVTKEEEGAEGEDKRESRRMQVVMPDGTVKQTDTAASRWSNMVLDWAEKSPEQKVATILRGLLSVFALAICVAVIFKESVLETGSIFRYVVDGNWHKGINIFAITACVMIICVISVAVMLIRNILKAMSRTFGTRGETVCRLLSSLIKYVAVIAGLYYCFALFGVDTKTLLASAGILSLVIGLGAKTLVEDIVAGLFMIFEGDFRVGDIVTVGDWRGTVVEIGVRTTKIEEPGNNIKIINNSAISGIINMTKKTSFAGIDVGIEYGESIERVEAILAKELPGIKERVPSIIDGPFYKGVTALADNSVNIKITACCAEGDRMQLARDLNREMKIIFDKHDINIPFPQVVINQPKEYQQATFLEKLQAEQFRKEQKELSKGLEELEDDDDDVK